MPALVFASVTLANYQIALPNQTVLGAGTTVNLQAIRGLRSLMGLRMADQPKAQQDGSYPGYNLLGPRVVQVDWRVFNPNVGTETALANLTGGWQNIQDPATTVLRAGDYLRQVAGVGTALNLGALQVQLPNRAYPLLVFGRPTKLDIPVDANFQYGDVTVPSEFTCTDPLIYDAHVVTANTGLPNPTSGARFNATFNLTFGSSTGGSITLNNTGLYQTAPFFVIQGPCTNPAIINQATTQQIKLNMALDASDTVTVDCQSGAVTLNATANRNNVVDPTSQFFTLNPGASTVQFTSTDGTAVAGTLTGYLLPAYSTV